MWLFRSGKAKMIPPMTQFAIVGGVEVSYVRRQKARKTSPRSISSLPDSTQKLSRKEGRVKTASVPIPNCLNGGVHPSRDVPVPTLASPFRSF